MTSDFNKGIPLGKVTVLAGESGAGKSYIASGNIIKNAQDQGIFVILIDTENALDEQWLQALNVDTSEDKLMKLSMSMVDDVAKTVSEFMKGYKDQHADNKEGAPKVLFVIDSLGMLLTPTDVNQFEAGEMKGDLGRKPKALTALVRNCVNMFGSWNVGLIATNHTYASQDMFDPDDKISGGQGFIYASSIVVAMKKLKLKEDEKGNKISDVRGIRAACKVMKTRYAKPFEGVQVKIPYDTGMDPYSGLVDLFEKKGDYIAAYMVEPIQGEAGVIVPEDDYFIKVSELCKKHNILLSMDEVQTGFGRTGRNFAHQLFGVKPDIMGCGKAAGGGILPVSFVAGSDEVLSVLTPGSEGSTFGGYPLASVVGTYAIKVMVDANLAENAEIRGAQLMNNLKDIQSHYPDKIKEVRGKGLLTAFEMFDEKHLDGHKVSVGLMDRGVYAKETHHTTVRLAPALTIESEQIETLSNAVKDVVASL